MTAEPRPFAWYLAQLATGRSLDEAEAEAAFGAMISGDATSAQMGGFLMGLRVRGETVAEITGAARSLRARALPLEAPEDAIDTCGTGGDASGTFNISTAAAFVVAACGVPVAKHGNRSLTSKSGSADVLTALGVNIDASVETMARAVREIGIGFMMAPRHHAATRHVAPVRLELGTRTIFNLLGPLSNPAQVRYQLVGVYAPEWVRPVAEVLHRLGSIACWAVHGDGMDELTTTGLNQIAALENGRVENLTLDARDLGLPRVRREDLAGGTPQDNAQMMLGLLTGLTGPLRDVVLLNAGAALKIAGKTANLADGITLAAAAIDSGHAHVMLDRLVAATGVAA